MRALDYETEEDEQEEVGTEIAVPMTLAEMISIREEILKSWQEEMAAIKRTKVAFKRIRDKSFCFICRDGEPREPALDYSLWVFALEKLNITNAMTGKARDEFLNRVKEKKTPFTEREIQGLAQNATRMFRESSLNTVRDVYRQLIGINYQSNDPKLRHKKDNLRKIEKVFRVGWSDVRYDPTWGRISNNYHSSGSGCFHFDDLLTVCRLIEGQGFTDYSNNIYSLVGSHKLEKGCMEVDTGWFVIRVYKNGNVKVHWNEEKMHVLDKFNAIGSGRENDLPDPMRKRYKAEHFHDGGMPKVEDVFAVKPDMMPVADKDFAFYPTPESAARRMLGLAEIKMDFEAQKFSILEPSAGDGAIPGAFKFENCFSDNPGSVLVEFNHHRAQSLRELYSTEENDPVVEADFLKWNPPHQFDRVLMNPPFHDRIEAVHVVKAFGHLKPGGILVAIIPEGWFTRDDIKAVVFRDWLSQHEYKPSEKLPPGTFGRTQIATRIVTLKKSEAM